MSYTNTKSKKKAGPENSRYRLYVKFKPAYQKARKDFNYFSDDRGNSDKGLRLLLKRVLHGSCKDRFEIAMLYDTYTNTCIKVYTPWHGESSYAEFKVILQKQQSRPLFKAYIVCTDPYINTLTKNNQRHPLTISSQDINPQTGQPDILTAFQYFHTLITKGQLKDNVKSAHIYNRRDQRVAIFSGDGLLTILDDKIKKELKHHFKFIH
jgi:hypothetical protein